MENRNDKENTCQCKHKLHSEIPWYFILMPFELGQLMGLGAFDSKNICRACNKKIGTKQDRER
jgi:hypothetical protein